MTSDGHSPAQVKTQRIAGNVSRVLALVADTCRQVGRDPQGVRLIAVTKEQTPEVLAPLLAAGICNVGENRLEHLTLMAKSALPEHQFHYIGRIQGRQLAKIIPFCTTLHSLCEPDHIERLGRACAAEQRCLSVFFQVNTANDDAKAGMLPVDISERLALAQRYAYLKVVGLMTMAPLGLNGAQADDNTVRRCFATLRINAEKHQLPRLSMGMSNDFQLAVAEGATDIRVGTRLFV
jgi:hypothetical protein